MDNTKEVDIKNQQIKIVISFLATAVVPAFLCSAMYFIPMMNKSLSGEFLQTPFEVVNSPSGIIGSSIALGIIAFFVALFHILILGVPLFLLGLRLKMIRWWTTFISAFTVGVLPYSFLSGFFAYDNLNEIPPGRLNEFFTLGLFGLSGGIAFWLIWRYWVLRKPFTNSDETQ